MGLYSSFSTAMYYDEEDKKPKQKQPEKNQEPKRTNQERPTLSEEKRKSLYDEAKELMSKEEMMKKSGPDFTKVYRVGQMVAVQGPNGQFRTKKGRIAEIPNSELMYIFMEDSHKDATGEWLADFVTHVDTIHTL